VEVPAADAGSSGSDGHPRSVTIDGFSNIWPPDLRARDCSSNAVRKTSSFAHDNALRALHTTGAGVAAVARDGTRRAQQGTPKRGNRFVAVEGTLPPSTQMIRLLNTGGRTVDSYRYIDVVSLWCPSTPYRVAPTLAHKK